MEEEQEAKSTEATEDAKKKGGREEGKVEAKEKKEEHQYYTTSTKGHNQHWLVSCKEKISGYLNWRTAGFKKKERYYIAISRGCPEY